MDTRAASEQREAHEATPGWRLLVPALLMIAASNSGAGVLTTSRTQAGPTIHCVSSTAQLLAALTDVQAAGLDADQEIRIQRGTYDLNGAAGIAINATANPFQVTIEGGYDPGDPGCTAPKPGPGAQYTTIANYTFIGINSAGSIALRDLSFSLPTAATGGHFGRVASADGLASISRVVMRGNPGGSDHLYVTGRNVIVADVLVSTSGSANCSLGVANSGIDGTSVVVQHATVVSTAAAVCLDGFNAQVRVSNSIALTNPSNGLDILDSSFGTAPVNLESNVYRQVRITGNGEIPNPQISGTINAGLEIFADAEHDDFSPALTLNNPIINSSALDLPVTLFDVFGNPRRVEQPDRGAIESDRVFGSAFE